MLMNSNTSLKAYKKKLLFAIPSSPGRSQLNKHSSGEPSKSSVPNGNDSNSMSTNKCSNKSTDKIEVIKSTVNFAYTYAINKRTNNNEENKKLKNVMIENIATKRMSVSMIPEKAESSSPPRVKGVLEEGAVKKGFEFSRNRMKKTTNTKFKNINLFELNSKNLENDPSNNNRFGSEIRKKKSQYDDLLYAQHNVDEFEKFEIKKTNTLHPQMSNIQLLSSIKDLNKLTNPRSKIYASKSKMNNNYSIFNQSIYDKLIIAIRDMNDLGINNMGSILQVVIEEKMKMTEQSVCKTNHFNYVFENVSKEIEMVRRYKDYFNETLFKIFNNKKNLYLNLANKHNEHAKYPQEHEIDNCEEACAKLLTKFKATNFANFKFVIPDKYKLDNSNKIIGEYKTSHGTNIKIFENYSVRFYMKNQNTHYIHPNGFMLTSFVNGNIRLAFNDGRIFTYFKEEKCSEFLFSAQGFSLIRYPNSQIEQYSIEGNKLIKHPDGAWEVILRDGTNYVELP